VLVVIGHRGLDPLLEIPARDVLGARDVAGRELVVLAHVDEHGAVLALCSGVRGVHLRDGLLDLADELRAARHLDQIS
jgi:hypothetical protein